MIRKDVKLGFAVGGVLLAVVIAYALVVGGGGKENTSTIDPGATAQNDPLQSPVPSDASPADPISSADATKPTVVTPVDPFRTDASNPPVASNQQQTPAEDPWFAALNTGSVAPPLMSRTPNLTDPRTGQTVAQPDASSSSPTPSNIPAGVSDPESPVANAPVGSNVPSVGTTESANRATTLTPSARSYTVQAGDNLAKIAESVYGSQRYWKNIVDANPGIDASRLKIGQVLNLPEISTRATEAGRADPARNPSSASELAVDARTQYRVQAGDSLFRISVKLYGKGDRVERLYELNRTAIGPDPARLKVGMVLQLPEPPKTPSN
jgi:nucleoid-associated protein YgaU